jgi:hypothetical protein
MGFMTHQTTEWTYPLVDPPIVPFAHCHKTTPVWGNSFGKYTVFLQHLSKVALGSLESSSNYTIKWTISLYFVEAIALCCCRNVSSFFDHDLDVLLVSSIFGLPGSQNQLHFKFSSHIYILDFRHNIIKCYQNITPVYNSKPRI